MNSSCALVLSAVLLGGCTSELDSAQERLLQCWKAERVGADRIKISGAEMIYLRGESVVVPSATCQGARLQVVDEAQSVVEVLDKIEHRNTASPLGFRGDILVEVVRIASRDVTEVNMLQLRDHDLLEPGESVEVLNRIYPG
jgi:hypothetical protein